MQEPFELDRLECEKLLRAGVTGRVAVATPSGPHIVPVNYSVVDDAIILRTSPYSILGTYGRDTTLAFEVDHVDYEHQQGWSVVARGRSAIVTDAEELDHIRATWPPQPWASGTRTLHLSLRWQELSGRKLGTGWDTLASMQARRVI